MATRPVEVEQFVEGRHVRKAYTDRSVGLSTGALHGPSRPGRGRRRAVSRRWRSAPRRSSRARTSAKNSGMFGQTAAEFMRHEVLPREPQLYAHDWALTRELMRKAAALDLARLEIPDGLRRPRPRHDQRGVRRRADCRQPVVCRVARRAHLRSARCRSCYFGTDEQKARYLPRLGSAELDRRLRAHRAAVGLRRARGADHRAADPGRPSLRAQRPEDVDHQRRVRRSLHDLREGRRRTIHGVPRRAGDGCRQRARTNTSSGSTARRRPR